MFAYDYDEMGGGMDMLGDEGAGADIESKLLGEHWKYFIKRKSNSTIVKETYL